MAPAETSVPPGSRRGLTGLAPQKGILQTLSYRWALQMAVEGDLRFLSHLDCLRAVARTAARGRVPLRFTQGFNPHPVFSLLTARPVGVTALADPVVFRLVDALEGHELQRRLNDHAPQGMRFSAPRLLESGVSLRVRSAGFELPIPEPSRPDVSDRLQELGGEDSWPAERVRPARRRGGPVRRTRLELRNLIENLRIDGGKLVWTAHPQGDLWARPEEVLRLVGLTSPTALGNVIRTHVACEP
jgi:radical SAM-linked protein